MSRARDLSKLVNILEVRDGSPFAITQDGRVGIGTTIPTSALSVEGDGEFTGIVSATSFKATGAFVGDGSGLTGIVGQGAGVVVRDGGSLIGVAGTIDFGGENFFVTPVSSGIVTVTTGPSSKWTQNNTGIHTLGNVGIGTTTASSTLSVLGSATISGVTTAGSLAIGATTVLTAARQLQNIASLDATTTATIEAAIQSSPNLFTELTVTGITTLGVTSTTDLSAQKLNVSGIATANSISIGATEVLSPGRQLKNITSVDGTTAASINAAISQATQNFPSIEVTGISSFMNGPVLVGSGSSTAVPDQKLQVTGGAYISSNLGIGTVDPKANLWVEGSTQVSGAATISGSTTLQGSLSVAGAFTQANAIAVIADASGSSNIFVGVATGAHGTDYQKTILIGEGGASGSLTNIVVGPTEGAAIGTFAVNSSTKVGIGSIYPTSQLSLEGDQYVSGVVTATTFSGTLSGLATGSFFGNIDSPITGVATIFNLQGTNVNVGLATANRFISTTGAYISGGSLNDGLRFELVSAANPLEFHEYTSIVASLDDKSYSQISPSATGDLYIAPQTTSAESSVRIFTGTGTPDFNAVERVTVTGGDNTNGNVGIGSTQPTSKLTVQGDVRISGVSTFNGNLNFAAPVTGVTTFSNNIYIDYNKALYFGNGNEFFVYRYDGSPADKTVVYNSSGALQITSIQGLSIDNGTRNYAIFDGSGTALYHTANDIPAVTLRYQTTDTGSIFYKDFSVKVNNGNDLFVVKNPGSGLTQDAVVGIGTTNPTSNLSVQGSVRVVGVSTFSSNINVGVNTSVGIVLTSPNGTKFRLHVQDDGTLSTVQV